MTLTVEEVNQALTEAGEEDLTCDQIILPFKEEPDFDFKDENTYKEGIIIGHEYRIDGGGETTMDVPEVAFDQVEREVLAEHVGDIEPTKGSWCRVTLENYLKGNWETYYPDE